MTVATWQGLSIDVHADGSATVTVRGLGMIELAAHVWQDVICEVQRAAEVSASSYTRVAERRAGHGDRRSRRSSGGRVGVEAGQP